VGHFEKSNFRPYLPSSLFGFSSVFREHVAEHKNLWGILKNQTPASMGIPISSISFSEMLVICP